MIQICSQKAQKVLQATENHIGFFPIRAVREARDIREELIPELINRVNFAIAQAKALPNNYMGHLFALYLLAEFRAREAFEPMLRVFFLSQEALNTLLGDILTEGLGSIAASIAMERYSELLAIFENKDLYEFARLAALSAIKIQIHNGLIDRVELEDRLKGTLQNAIRENDLIAVTALTGTVCTLKLNGLVDVVREAFDSELIDTFQIDRGTFEQFLQNEPFYGTRQYEQLVSTAEESMSWWHSFKNNSNRKVQRNELCPCASGLKYKHCCIK